jgi:RNA polymerase sigma-70 factor (ECF subfamily)
MVLVAGEPGTRAGALEDELGAVWDRHAQDARRVLAAFGLREERLDDALQETFARLGAALRRGGEARSPRAFLLGIARHVAVDVTARARRTEPLAREPQGREGAPDERAAQRELAGLVRAACEELPAELRSALHLRHVGGLTMEELAEALDCSVPTARARLTAAGHRLAGELRRRGVVPAAGEGRA